MHNAENINVRTGYCRECRSQECVMHSVQGLGIMYRVQGTGMCNKVQGSGVVIVQGSRVCNAYGAGVHIKQSAGVSSA